MIETYTCKNGLRIVLEPVPTVRSVSIGIWVLTGSRNEAESTNGISHFLEHMFFKGTKKRTAQQIAEAFDSIGGQVNAFTSKEYTCFYARVLDTYTEYALDVLTDMLFHSTFSEEEIEREKKVILEEIKMYEDAPDDYVHDLLAEASFSSHPLGRPIIGTEKQIKSFSKQMLTDFMETYYTANNIVVSIAGNVEPSLIYKMEQFFQPLNDPQQTIVREKPIFQAHSIHKRKNVEQAHLCLGYQGFAIDDPSISTMLIINSVLGGGMSSRLFQEVREKMGLAYSVFSFHASYLDAGLLTIYAGTDKDQVQLLQTTIEQIIQNLVEHGLTDKEFVNSKERLKGNMMLSLESTYTRMSRNGRNELLLGKQRSLDEIIEEIDAIDQAMIQDVLKHIFLKQHAQALIIP
ncbi:MAG TPA: pitrilysin family protein [Pseudogracilibacillus sp.]|nr:pitrilysin family protein [Pseudogracilibacillus sp.]